MKKSIAVKLFFCFLMMYAGGCWQNKFIFYQETLNKPSSSWNEQDCRSVIEAHTDYNRYDNDAPVQVISTVYTPGVIVAVNRQDQMRKQWTEAQYHSSLEAGITRLLGLTMKDSSNLFYDSNNYLYKNETQLDSIVFLVSISSRSNIVNISSEAPLFNSPLGNLFDLKNFQFYDPDLFELKDKIFLQNSQGMLLKPNWVGGKGKGQLIGDESFLVMFQLQQPAGHFLEFSKKMALVVRGFERDIRLSFQLASSDSQNN